MGNMEIQKAGQQLQKGEKQDGESAVKISRPFCALEFALGLTE